MGEDDAIKRHGILSDRGFDYIRDRMIQNFSILSSGTRGAICLRIQVNQQHFLTSFGLTDAQALRCCGSDDAPPF